MLSGARQPGVGKPMILNKILNETYKFPCLECDNSYSEISNTIKNTTDKTYNSLIESITKYNYNEMLNNQKKFDKFLLNCLKN